MPTLDSPPGGSAWQANGNRWPVCWPLRCGPARWDPALDIVTSVLPAMRAEEQIDG